MSSKRIYALTSIARPLEPEFPTNKAVLILLPIIAVACALYQLIGPGEQSPGAAALSGALAAFAGWALTRELAPDDNPAAFISMTLGVAGVLFVGIETVLPAFVALFLVRIVNRSVGKPATRIDSLLILVLAVGAGWSLDKPVLTWVGAAAFLLDARLAPRSPVQLLPAVVCVIAPVVWQTPFVVPSLDFAVPSLEPVLSGNARFAAFTAMTLLYAYAGASTRQLAATGDATGEPLVTARVRGGMLVGVLVAVESLLAGDGQFAAGYDALLWSCIAGVGVGNMLRLARPRS